MAFDYTELADVATELVAEFGRSVTLIQLNAGPSNPAKPWRGATDPRSAPPGSKTVSAVFVDPSSLDALGKSTLRDEDWVMRSDQIAIIASADDLALFDEMIDTDGERFKVTGVRSLRPGAVRLLAYVGVAR